MIKKLPDVCSDCAEYGSTFCNDCLDEINKTLSDDEKVVLSKQLRNIAGMIDEEVGITNPEKYKK